MSVGGLMMSSADVIFPGLARHDVNFDIVGMEFAAEPTVVDD